MDAKANSRRSIRLRLLALVLLIGIVVILFATIDGPSSNTRTANVASDPASLVKTPLTPIPTMEGGPPTRFPAPVGTSAAVVTSLPSDYVDPEFAAPTAGTVVVTPQPTHQPSDPVDGVLYAERLTEIDRSAIASDLIVLATVKKVGPSRWSTPDGKRPANPHATDNQDYIFTPITVVVTQYVKGAAKTSELLIRGYGGTVGKDRQLWGGDDLYAFVEGDTVMLFLSRDMGFDALERHTQLDMWDVTDRFSIKDGQAFNSYHNLSLQALLDQVEAAIIANP